MWHTQKITFVYNVNEKKIKILKKLNIDDNKKQKKNVLKWKKKKS